MQSRIAPTPGKTTRSAWRICRVMGDQHTLGAHVLQRTGNGVQVAHAVVDNGDSTGLITKGLPYKTPLVEGVTPAMRGSGVSAMRSGATEGLEYRLRLVVAVVTAQVVDVQGDQRVIHEALEEFHEQVHVETTHGGAGEVHVEHQIPGARRSR